MQENSERLFSLETPAFRKPLWRYKRVQSEPLLESI
jgi:hypothetical protein